MTQYRYSARETNRVTARGLSSVEISNVKTCRLGLASHFHERLTHVALYENRAKQQLLIANIKNEKLEKTDTYSYYKCSPQCSSMVSTYLITSLKLNIMGSRKMEHADLNFVKRYDGRS